MNAKLPRLTSKQLIKLLSKLGISARKGKGSHICFKGEYKGEKVFTTINIADDRLPIGTLKSVLKDCDLSRKEFIELIRKYKVK